MLAFNALTCLWLLLLILLAVAAAAVFIDIAAVTVAIVASDPLTNFNYTNNVLCIYLNACLYLY